MEKRPTHEVTPHEGSPHEGSPHEGSPHEGSRHEGRPREVPAHVAPPTEREPTATTAGQSPGQAAPRTEFPTVDTRPGLASPSAATLPLHTGTEAPPTASLRQAAQGRIVEREHIAQGGMATVHRAFDRLLVRNVAIKRLRAGACNEDRFRFVAEAQITGQLDHPNIVPVYDLLSSEGGIPGELAMKLIEGQTLHDLHHRRAKDDPSGSWLRDGVKSLIKVCDAVAFAHGRGVVHRDLKPSNVMVGTHGQVYVMDWGIALVVEPAAAVRGTGAEDEAGTLRLGSLRTRNDEAGSLCGTPAFMAPEQARGDIDAIDPRTDVYGIGGILFHMLTHKAPHDGGDLKTDLDLAKSGRQLVVPAEVDGRLLPPALCRIAERALCPDPDGRYATVAAMQADLEGFLSGGGWFAEQHFAAGETILVEGDEGQAAYIIVEGHCELRKRVDGKDRFVRLLGPGEVLGEAAVLGNSVRSATVTASTPVRARVVTRETLGRELTDNHWLGAIAEALAERFLEADRRATRLQAEVEALRQLQARK